VELGQVGAGRKLNPYLRFVTGLMIILSDSFADLRSRSSNDGIGVGVVLWIAAENLDTERSLLDVFLMSLK